MRAGSVAKAVGIAVVAVMISAGLAAASVPGDRDPSFGTNGLATTRLLDVDTSIDDVAMQTDGKIVIVGGTTPTATNYVVARFNADGTLDPSFDDDGIALTLPPSATSSAARAVAVQPDGRIIVAGVSDPVGVGVVRYMPDGQLDPSFSGDGFLPIQVGPAGSFNTIEKAAVQPDGSILVAGSTKPSVLDRDWFIAKITPDGSLDTSFNGDGILIDGTADLPEEFADLALDSAGGIIASVNFYDSVHRLIRLHSDGSRDLTFGAAGAAIGPQGEFPSFITIQPDGKILAAANISSPHASQNPSNDLLIVRFLADGTLDPGFGTDGSVRFPQPTTTHVGTVATMIRANYPTDIAVAGDGTILVTELWTSQVAGRGLVLVRLSPTGALDFGFGENGAVWGFRDDTEPSLEFVPWVFPLADGTILTVTDRSNASLGHHAALRRFLGGGTVTSVPPPSSTFPVAISQPLLDLDPCQSPSPHGFVDVAPTSFASSHIACIRQLGVTRGTSPTEYSPAQNVTREQMAAFLDRLYQVVGSNPCPSVPTPFSDVSGSSFAFTAIGCIYALDVTTGTGPATFDPGGFVTREQMAAFLGRFYEAVTEDACPSPGTPFTDVSLSSFAYEAVGCIYGLKVTTGTGPSSYDPEGFVTREQMAAFLSRLYQALRQAG